MWWFVQSCDPDVQGAHQALPRRVVVDGISDDGVLEEARGAREGILNGQASALVSYSHRGTYTPMADGALPEGVCVDSACLPLVVRACSLRLRRRHSRRTDPYQISGSILNIIVLCKGQRIAKITMEQLLFRKSWIAS